MLAIHVKLRAAVFVDRVSRILILDGEQNGVTNLILYDLRTAESGRLLYFVCLDCLRDTLMGKSRLALGDVFQRNGKLVQILFLLKFVQRKGQIVKVIFHFGICSLFSSFIS